MQNISPLEQAHAEISEAINDYNTKGYFEDRTWVAQLSHHIPCASLRKLIRNQMKAERRPFIRLEPTFSYVSNAPHHWTKLGGSLTFPRNRRTADLAAMLSVAATETSSWTERQQGLWLRPSVKLYCFQFVGQEAMDVFSEWAALLRTNPKMRAAAGLPDHHLLTE